ncbi:MAG TPA: winged helix-turn-helix domain-containing protein [Gemmatimonadales bacterium]|jgi:DNA-binding transcriptional ArsR family regulator
MPDSPDIAAAAAIFGDPTRARILTALMADRPLTATELARHTGVTKPTISAHLARLSESGFVAIRQEGRHRFVRLAHADVGRALEALMNVAERAGLTRSVPGPDEPSMRKARICYDHLAGDLGVLVFDGLVKRGALEASGSDVSLTSTGERLFADQGIELEALREHRRPLCLPCLDWSVKRHHLAGALGAALLDRCLRQGWARRDRRTRTLHFSAIGERSLRAAFAR